MRTFIVILFIAVLAIVSPMLSTSVCAQAQLQIASPRPNVSSNANTLPTASTSKLQIFADGEWLDDVETNFDPTKPTLILVHGWQNNNLDVDGNLVSNSISEYWIDATEALHSRTKCASSEGDINLLAWNWLAGASTSLLNLPIIVPNENTFNEGLLLQEELEAINPIGKIHFVGHSLGAKIACVTSLACDNLPVDQLTLFDAPENLTSNSLVAPFLATTPVYLHDDIRELLARGIFIDTYCSAFGTNYQEYKIPCANMNMKPPISITGLIQTFAEAHRYPIKWYFGGNSGTLGSPAGTINHTSGQITQSVGAAWSKVLNQTADSEEINANRKTFIIGPDHENPIEGLQFEPWKKNKSPYDLIPIKCLRADKTTSLSEIAITTTGEQTWRTNGDCVIENNQATLTASESPVFLFTDAVIPSGLVTLQFDFKITSPNATDKLTLFAQDKLIWTLNGKAVQQNADSFITTNLIDISSFADQTATLTFCYASESENQSAVITNIKITSKPKLPFYELETQCFGQGTVIPEYRLCEKDTTISMVAIPDEGYQVLFWQNADNGSGLKTNINSVKMTEKKLVSVSFLPDEYAFCLFTSLGIPFIILAGFTLISTGNPQPEKSSEN